MKTIIYILVLCLVVGCDNSSDSQTVEAPPVNANQPKSDPKPNVVTKADDSSENIDDLVSQGELDIGSGRIAIGIEKLEKAVAKQNPRAMYLLAGTYKVGYKAGINVEPDAVKSFSLFRRAAELGYPDAMAALAVCYMDGNGTEKDPEKSEFWLRKAINAGSKLAIIPLAERLYQSARFAKILDRESHDDHPTEKERSFAKEAIDLLGKLKDADDETYISANLILGRIYLDGIGVPINTSLGKAHYEKCIARNSKTAMWELGKAYCDGRIYTIDYDKGVSLIKQSMTEKEDNPDKYIVLGNAYLDSSWCAFDLDQGIAYLEQAITLAERESKRSKHSDVDYKIRNELYVLGRIYAFEERGLSQLSRGIELLQRAAEARVHEAAYYLAVLYYNGDGVKKNLSKASSYAMDAKLSNSTRIKESAKRLDAAIDAIQY